MTEAGQPAVGYTYDNADRLTGLTQGTSTVTLAYDSTNRRTTLTLPNGVQVAYNYNTASQLTGLTYTLGTTTLGDLTYSYDGAGRRSSLVGSFARTGLPLAVASATYDAANELTKWGTASPTYDANGNLTNDGVNIYSWDARNHLKSVTAGSTTLGSFIYDAVGRRVGRTLAGTTTSLLYDGSSTVQELSGTAPTANLLTGLGIDEILTRTDSAGTRNFLADGLGSSLALLDSAGTVQTQYTYDPFGATSFSGLASSNSFQYTGRENDGTGLYYYRARYYSPTIQRFISEDPLGFVTGVNFYTYVDNSPINLIDPTGLTEYPDNFMGPLPRWGYHTSEMTLTPCGRVPPHPPSASIDQNIASARNRWNPWWFKDQVRNKGPWDYKQQNPQYEDFGNFNYGATGYAFGFPEDFLLREAGRASLIADPGRKGMGLGDPGSRFNPRGGTPPYGDDPADQIQIKKGVAYEKCMAGRSC